MTSSERSKRWRGLLVVALATALAGCEGRPAVADGDATFQQQVRTDWGDAAKVRSFEKTDGLAYEKNGVKAYEMEYVAVVERPEHGSEEVTGTISFVRTERGWNVASISGQTEQQRQAALRREEDIANRANVTRARQDIRTFDATLQLYKLDNGNYPSTQQGLAALVSPPDSEPKPTHYKPGGYMKFVRNDPWGNPYQYVSPGTRSEFDLFSFGADGQPGGDGTAADIGNWDH